MTYSAISRPVCLSSASNNYQDEAAYGECDQAVLIRSLRDLLSLYYQPDETPQMRARQIALFVKDMADFSDDCAGWAIDEWRRNQDRRPSPASLRQLGMRRKQEAFGAIKSRPEPMVPHIPYAEPDLEERKEVIERINRNLGHVLHRGRYVSPTYVADDVQPRKPHWSETAAPDDPRWAALRKSRAANALMNPEATE